MCVCDSDLRYINFDHCYVILLFFIQFLMVYGADFLENMTTDQWSFLVVRHYTDQLDTITVPLNFAKN